MVSEVMGTCMKQVVNDEAVDKHKSQDAHVKITTSRIETSSFILVLVWRLSGAVARVGDKFNLTHRGGAW